MDRDGAIEPATIAYRDSVERRCDTVLGLQHLLDKGAREEPRSGGKPNDIGIAAVDRLDRSREGPFSGPGGAGNRTKGKSFSNRSIVFLNTKPVSHSDGTSVVIGARLRSSAST